MQAVEQEKIDLLTIIQDPSRIHTHGLSRWDVGALLKDLFYGRTSSMVHMSCDHADRLRTAGFRIACLHHSDREEGLHNVIFPVREED